jgi:hypothetical protein
MTGITMYLSTLTLKVHVLNSPHQKTTFGKLEMQIKTKLRFHLTPLRIAIIKKIPPTTSVGEDVGKKKPLYTAIGNAR